MKYLIFFAAFVTIFSACATKKKKKHTPVPTKIVALFRNPYRNMFGLDSVFRVIKDTTKEDEDGNKTTSTDTIYYIPITSLIPNPKDSTHKTNLKTKDGQNDSLELKYYPISPSEIQIDITEYKQRLSWYH